MNDLEKQIKEIERTIEKFSGLIRLVIIKTSPTIDDFDIHDIEQEIKIKIWKQLVKCETEIRNLNSYIWRISYTTVSRKMQRLSKQRKLFVPANDDNLGAFEVVEGSKIPSPNGELENKEIRDMIGESVNSLIETRRQVVKLYLSGLNVKAISELLDWSRAKARNLLYRGLEDLRKNLLEKGIGYGSRKGRLKGGILGDRHENEG